MTTTEEPTVTHAASTVLQARKLGTLFANAVVFAGKDKKRPALHVVLLEFSEHQMRLVSTDSYSLLRQDHPAEVEAAGKTTALLDSDVVNDWSKLLAKAGAEESALLAVDGTRVTLKIGGDVTVECDVVDSKFPSYEMLWPVYEARSVEVDGLLGAFNPSALTKLAKVKVPGYSPKEQAEVPVRCLGLDTAKPSIWQISADNFDAQALVMPLRVS